VLNVRSSTDPGDTVEVFRCPAGRACDAQPLGWTDESVGSVDVGATAPGDVFEARIVSSSGAVVEALRTPPGTDCMMLSYGRAVVLSAAYAGWYAFAPTGFASSHGQPAAAMAAPPFPIASVTPGPAVAGPLGPINEPKRPTASVRKRARRAKGKLTVARVTCPERCTVRLRVSGHGRTIRRTLSVTGRRALRIPMRHGRLKVRVVVDGKLLAKGVSRWHHAR
jgi:hypothetical protein